MACEFKKLPRKLYPKAPIRKESKEQLYWKSFQVLQIFYRNVLPRYVPNLFSVQGQWKCGIGRG